MKRFVIVKLSAVIALLQTFTVSTAGVSAVQTPDGAVMENAFLKVKIVKSGGKIASFVDKKRHIDLLQGASGVNSGFGQSRR